MPRIVQTSGVKGAIINLIARPLLNNTAVFREVQPDRSCMWYDSSATSYTNGNKKSTYVVSAGQNIIIDLSHGDTSLAPSDILSIVARATQTTTDLAVAIAWTENQ